jgi:hypothetical protein
MQEKRPGVLDDASFDQHWSVPFWRNWSWPPPGAELTTPDGLRTIASEVAKNARQARVWEDSTSAAYWAYHVARAAYFSVQYTTCFLGHILLNGAVIQGRPATLSEEPIDFERLAMNTVGAPSCVGVSLFPRVYSANIFWVHRV